MDAMTMRKRPMTVIAGALLLVAAGCSGGGSGGSAPVTSDSRPDAPSLPGPGSKVTDGLVVPSGAHLAGQFVMPDLSIGAAPDAPGAPIETRTTVFVLDGNPFAAFDALAAQLRAPHIGAAMAGTADACLWTSTDTDGGQTDGVVAPNSGAGAGAEASRPSAETPTTSPTTGPTAQGSPQDAYNRHEREQVERQFITDAPPPAGLTGVHCSAKASASQGPTPSYGLTLDWTRNGDASMTLTEDGAPIPGEARSTAQVTTLLRQLQGAEQTIRDPRPGPVPSVAARHLPDPSPVVPVAAGVRFGPITSCVPGGSRFRLPDDARLAGVEVHTNQPDPVAGAVLAVDPDLVDRVLVDLGIQATQDGTSTSDQRTVALARGGSATVVLLTKVSDGDHGCHLLVSPDRTRILVTSDP